uniref:Phage protein n=1 Tax=Strongyloides stercoralis TaxID=6248 RepID=A0A0K0EQD3_STRER
MAFEEEVISKDLLNKIKEINKATVDLDKAWKEYKQSFDEVHKKYPKSAEFETYDQTNKAQLGIMLSRLISIFGGDVESYNKHIKMLMPVALSIAVDQMEDVPKETMSRINKNACGNIINNALFDIDEYNDSRNGGAFEDEDNIAMEEDSNSVE